MMPLKHDRYQHVNELNRALRRIADDANDRAARAATTLHGVASDRVHVGGPRPTWAHPGNGERFVARQHRRVLAGELRARTERDAPPEVAHRRVGGRTVVARRLLSHRSHTVPDGYSSVRRATP